MNAFGVALLAIFCTPMGWIGMIIAGVVIYKLTH